MPDTFSGGNNCGSWPVATFTECHADQHYCPTYGPGLSILELEPASAQFLPGCTDHLDAGRHVYTGRNGVDPGCTASFLLTGVGQESLELIPHPASILESGRTSDPGSRNGLWGHPLETLQSPHTVQVAPIFWVTPSDA